MTVVDQMVAIATERAGNAPAEAGRPGEGAEVTDRAGTLLMQVFDALDRDGLQYCVLHGYETYPHRVPSDVDCLVPREMLPTRLGGLLRTQESLGRARVVQWFEDRAHWIVLATREAGGTPPVLLQLHVGSDYDVRDRVIFTGDEVLRTRRRFRDRFWVPAAQVEFASLLANRLAKGEFKEKHFRQLSSLWAEAPAACRGELDRLLGAASAKTIAAAAEAGKWDAVVASAGPLRQKLLSATAWRQPLSVAARVVSGQLRRMRRWLSPQNGLHVVFLGPDGVGKSTVIEAVQQRLSPAFLRCDYQTFARG
ncbi:MAG: hypothetical protein ABIP55_12495, partial [Tepidisphaeraceae bacterium]